MKAMKREQLIDQFPCLYHMAEAGSWDSILRHGLLSTSALLDLFEVTGRTRYAIESTHRPECISVSHRDHGMAVVRDQKPMSDSGLKRCLNGLSPRKWYELLNRRVFFWLTERRLQTLLCARAYRDRAHTVILVDTAQLVEQHLEKISLSPLNSGCTKPFPHPRGKDTFRSVSDFPFESRCKEGRKPEDAVVELAVDYAVYDITEFATRVETWKGSKRLGTIWKR